MRRLILIGLLMLWATASPVSAATYWVSQSGSDANGCTDSGSPLTTTAKLTVSAGVACMSAAGGHTVYIRSGTYTGSLNMLHSTTTTINGGTSWGNPNTIAAYTAETVVLEPGGGVSNVIGLHGSAQQYLIFDRLILDGTGLVDNGTWGVALYMDIAHHIRFQNGEIRDAPGQGVHCPSSTGGFHEILNSSIHHNGNHDDLSHGIYLACSDNLIDGNTVNNNRAYGITIYSGSQEPSRNIVRENAVRDNPSGIGLAGGDDNQAFNNLIWGVGASNYGINVQNATPTNSKVWNNTVYAPFGIYIHTDSTGAEVRNNITYYTSGSHSVDDSGTSTTLSTNLSSNPSFVDAASANFHLQAGSAAREAGTTVGSVTVDYDGVSRPQESAYEIGAFEYPVGGPPVPIPPARVRVID